MSAASGRRQRIFISYRREETSGHAGRIYDSMVTRFGEDNVFMDVDIAPGVDFVDYITEVVSGCTVLIAVMGKNWAEAPGPDGLPRLHDEADFVRLEVGAAVQNPDVTVIPALVDKARMPKPDQLPDEMRPLARRNALELSDGRWRYDVGRLNETLEQLLAGLTGFPLQVQPEPPTPLPEAEPPTPVPEPPTPAPESPPIEMPTPPPTETPVPEEAASPTIPLPPPEPEPPMPPPEPPTPAPEPAAQASASWKPWDAARSYSAGEIARFVAEAVLVAVVIAFLLRTLADIIPKAGEQLTEAERHRSQVIRVIIRRAVAWGVTADALALWLALRWHRTDFVRCSLRGLAVGALAGAVGAAIYAIPTKLPEEAVPDSVGELWALAALAVTGALIGALIGSLWRRPRLGLGLAAGLLGGALAQLLFNTFSWNPETMPGVAFNLALSAGFVAGAAVLALLLAENGLSRSSASARAPAGH